MTRNDHSIHNMNDLLNMPDINGIMKDLHGEVYSPSVTRQQEKPMEKPSALWMLFLRHAKRYAYRTRKDNRKNYEIDGELIDLLKLCDINRMSVSDIINAALRSFIDMNREQLAECMRKSDYLLNTQEYEDTP